MRAVLEIARRRGVKVIAKGKTMISEEIELNHALEAAGLTPVETDLGEWIVQLAGERPSHILAPVIHRSRGQIADVLAVHSGAPDGGRPAGARHLLARGAALGLPRGRHGHHRRQLHGRRERHRDRARERGQRPPRLVAPRAATSMLAGLERILETTADAAFMVEQLSLAAVGRQLPSYVSWLSGPPPTATTAPRSSS